MKEIFSHIPRILSSYNSKGQIRSSKEIISSYSKTVVHQTLLPSYHNK